MIELLIVVAVVALVLGLAVAGVQRARIAANESAAVASLRSIGKAQISYAASCGNGLFAATLRVLGTPPATGGEAYIPPDLVPASGSSLDKSGYRLVMGGQVVADAPTACNSGAVASGFYVSADPLAPGSTGNRYFWTNSRGTVYEHTASMAGQTMGGGNPTMGTAIR